MVFERGLVMTKALGTTNELYYLASLLTFVNHDGSLVCFVGPEQTFFSGLVSWVKTKMEEEHFEITVSDVDMFDEAQAIESIEISDDIITTSKTSDFRLRDYQCLQARKAVYRRRGIIDIAPRGGKTEVALAVCRYLWENKKAERVLFLAPYIRHVEQAYNRSVLRGFKNSLLVPLEKNWSYKRTRKGEDIELIFSTVASVYAAVKRQEQWVLNLLADCDVLILDEVHHLKANSWINVVSNCYAPYRYGLTGTVFEDPRSFVPEDVFLIGLTGPVISHLPAYVLVRWGYLAEPVITFIPVDKPKVNASKVARKNRWHYIYREGVVNHPVRNSLACSLASQLYSSDYRVLMLVVQIKHGKALLQTLYSMGVEDIIFAKGSPSNDHRSEVFYMESVSGRPHLTKCLMDEQEISKWVEERKRCVLIGSTVFDESADLPMVNALINVSGTRKFRRTLQRVCRALTAKPGDNFSLIFDFSDDHNFTLGKHANDRHDIYQFSRFSLYYDLSEVNKRLGKDVVLEYNLPYFIE